MSNVLSNVASSAFAGLKFFSSEAFQFLSDAEEGIEMLAEEVCDPPVVKCMTPETETSYECLFPLRRKNQLEFSQDLEKDQIGGLYRVTEDQANSMMSFMPRVTHLGTMPRYSNYSKRQLGHRPLTYIPDIPLNTCLNCPAPWDCPAHIFMDYQPDLTTLMARDAATNIVKGISPELVTDFSDAKSNADHCYLSSAYPAGDGWNGNLVLVKFGSDSDSFGVSTHYQYQRSKGMGNRIVQLRGVPRDYDNTHVVAFKLD